MKHILAIALLFCTLNSKSQVKAVVWQGWDIVFDSTGKEAARRDVITGKWEVTNPAAALEAQYREMKSIRPKYAILYQMLMLVHDGQVSDKKRWQTLLAHFLKLDK